MVGNFDTDARIREILSRRIMILDGAHGTLIQSRKLTEADYRGTQFAAHPKDLRLNGDLLNITQPAIIEDIHFQYLEAGCDIIETNTFTSNAISQAAYGLQDHVREMNRAGVACAMTAPAPRSKLNPNAREASNFFMMCVFLVGLRGLPGRFHRCGCEPPVAGRTQKSCRHQSCRYAQRPLWPRWRDQIGRAHV